VLRKVVLFVLTLWGAVTLNFVLPRLMPGSPVDAALEKIAASGQAITNAQRRAVEIQLGSPHGSLLGQYWDYLVNIAQFKFGRSFSFPTETVAQTIEQPHRRRDCALQRFRRGGGAATRSDGLDHRERRLQVGNRQARHTTRPRFDSHGATRHASPQSSGKSVRPWSVIGATPR